MTGICESCEKECMCKIVNDGIGPYEYWGAKCYDEKLIVVSNCCGEPCIDSLGDDIFPEDVKKYEESERDYYVY